MFDSLLKRNSCVFFMLVVLVMFSSTAFSNQSLRVLQNQADRLENGGTFALSGSSKIDGTVVFKGKSNITIDGHGQTITQLKRNAVIIKIVDCNNVTIRDIVLVGDPSSYKPFKGTDGLGVSMQRCTGQHLLEKVKFYDHGTAGFKAHNVSNITFDQCLFSAETVAVKAGDAFNSGIWSYGTKCSNWEIKNCLFYKTAMGLILYMGHDHLDIHDNTFMDIRGQHGMYLNASSHVNIYNNKLTNIRYLGIKLQMNNGHKETETDIRITNNICTVEETNSPGQAGIAVGSAKPEGPAKGVYWEGVHIENNRVDRFDYGIQVNYAKKVNIQNNELVDTTYGILAVPCSGYIRDNVITTTKWSGIFCNVIKKSKVAIVDNVIKDPVHVTDGDIYKRCGIFLSGNGTVDLENNQMYRGKGQPLFGVYQGVDVTLGRYYNNRLLGPVVSNGRIVSQGNNDIH